MIKKYKIEIIEIIICSIINVIMIGISQIHYKYDPALIEFNKILFSSLISIITIWFSGYFILIQLYKNTYPMEKIQISFLKSAKRILIYSLSNILLSICIILTNGGNIVQYYFVVSFIFNILVIFINLYNINRLFTLNTYIKKDYLKLNKIMKNSKIRNEQLKKEITKLFKTFVKLFDDCISRNEYYSCKNISRITGELFRDLIKECNNMKIEGKHEIVDFLFKKIIIYNYYQISNSKNCNSDNFLEELFLQQKENICLCIGIDRFEWFKEYFSKINIIAAEDEGSPKRILELITEMNSEIGEEVLKKDTEWLEFFISHLYKLNVSLKFAFKNANFNYFSIIIIKLLKNCKEDNYEILKRYFREYTIQLTQIDDKIEDVVVSYSLYGMQILEQLDINKVKDFIDIITNKENRTIRNEKWNEYILYYLVETAEKWEELREENRKKTIEIILNLSINELDYNYYSFLPKYKKITEENKKNTIFIDEITEELEELIRKSIINNNYKMFFIMLNILKSSLLVLNKDDKNSQEKLLKVFFNTIAYSINKNNKEFIETSTIIFKDAIRCMDNDKKISKELGKNIINNLSEIARGKINNVEENKIYIAEIMYDLLEHGNECSFIVRDADNKKLLYKKVYNIGIECIEDNEERAVRVVSNILGWFIIDSINNDAAYLTRYLIDRSIDLYNMAKNMKVTEKTIIFILTLFTTVGTYCENSPKDRYILEEILKMLKNEETDIIYTAIDLRTKENDIWDDLYKGKTEELTKKFKKDLIKIKATN